MKLWLTIVLLLLFGKPVFSQCPTGNNDPLCKYVLGGLIYAIVFDGDDPDDYEASEFPNPYIDLQGSSNLDKQMKILKHLTYGDQIGVFDYSFQPSYCFKNNYEVTRIEALIALMEGWNIPPDYTGSINYNDIDPESYIFGYVNEAEDLDLINGSGNFDPYEVITVGETIDLIINIQNTSYHPVNENLNSLNNYFVPGIYTPRNLTRTRGFDQGVLNHYAKNSFVIPDRKLSLNFSHFYSTMMVEMPQSFYPIKPLSRGWSHTYNSYITREVNVIGNDDLFFITWPDGTVHIYNEDENEYESEGVYDDFDDNGNEIVITKKNHLEYTYEDINDDNEIWYLVKIEDPNGNEIEIDYENAEADEYHRINYIEAPSGKRLTFDYLDDTDLIENIEDPIGRDLYFEYNGISGTWVYEYPVLATFEDAEGNTTTYSYDINSPYEIYLLNRIQLPRGNLITADYDDDGKVEEYEVNNDGTIEINVDYDYGNDERIVDIDTPLPSGGMFSEEYELDERGLITSYDSDTDNVQINYPSSGINVMLPSNTNYNGLDIEYDYDNDGNIEEIDIGNGAIVEEFDYDDNDLIWHRDPNGNETEFIYDNNYNLEEVIYANNSSTIIEYDNFGQVEQVTNQTGIIVNYDYDSQDGALNEINAPEGISISYLYDDVNRMLQKDANGLISNYMYDDNDNLTFFQNSGGIPTSYNYDENDNLTRITNGNGIQTNFEYDFEDRVIEEEFGNLTKQYTYGDEGYLEEYEKPSGADIDYDYDNDGRLKETGTITDIDYNNRNLVSSISNNTGTIDFTYTNQNRVNEVTTVHGYELDYDWYDGGQIEEIDYPTFNGTTFKVEYFYNNKNLIERVDARVNGSSITIAEFEYLDDDRLEQIEYGNNTTANYLYDDAGRLTQVDHINENNGSNIYSFTQVLNPRGNILSQTENFVSISPGNGSGFEPAVIDYGYDDNNQITNAGGTNYNVDDDGNTVEIGNRNLEYDIDDRLISYQDSDNTIEFEYNPYNQRVEVTRNGESTKYIRDVINDNVIVELDGQLNIPRQYYVYAPNGMLLARSFNGEDFSFYHGDLRGSTIAITNDDAEITHQYRYTDFGEITEIEEPTLFPNPFRYVGIYGVEYELEDLYYMRARYYRPSIGRFLTQDPIWSNNLYPYAENNPISNNDPLGETSNGLTSTLSSTDPNSNYQKELAKQERIATHKCNISRVISTLDIRYERELNSYLGGQAAEEINGEPAKVEANYIMNEVVGYLESDLELSAFTRFGLYTTFTITSLIENDFSRNFINAGSPFGWMEAHYCNYESSPLKFIK